MINCVTFKAQAFPEPALQLRVVRLHFTRHDADGRTAVDLLESIQNGSKVCFVLRRISHVVDRQHDDGFNAFFADPLRRDELRKILVRIPRIAFVEIRKAIGVRRSLNGFVGQKKTGEHHAAEKRKCHSQHRKIFVAGVQVGILFSH